MSRQTWTGADSDGIVDPRAARGGGAELQCARGTRSLEAVRVEGVEGGGVFNVQRLGL